MEELYRSSHAVSGIICAGTWAQDLDDKVHDTFLIVVQAIQKGELREPERLMGFVRTSSAAKSRSDDRAVQNRREQADMDSTVECPTAAIRRNRPAIAREHEEVARLSCAVSRCAIDGRLFGVLRLSDTPTVIHIRLLPAVLHGAVDLSGDLARTTVRTKPIRPSGSRNSPFWMAARR